MGMQNENWTFKFMIRFLIHTLVMALWSFPIGLYVEAMHLQCSRPECALFRKRVLLDHVLAEYGLGLFSRHFFCLVWSCTCYTLSRKKLIFGALGSISDKNCACRMCQEMLEPDFWCRCVHIKRAWRQYLKILRPFTTLICTSMHMLYVPCHYLVCFLLLVTH